MKCRKTAFSSEYELFSMALRWCKVFHSENRIVDRIGHEVEDCCNAIVNEIDFNKIPLKVSIEALESVSCKNLRIIAYELMRNFIFKDSLKARQSRIYSYEISLLGAKIASKMLLMVQSLLGNPDIKIGNRIYTFGKLEFSFEDLNCSLHRAKI